MVCNAIFLVDVSGLFWDTDRLWFAVLQCWFDLGDKCQGQNNVILFGI